MRKNLAISQDILDGMEELAEYDAFTNDRVERYDHDPSRIDALMAQTASGGKVHAVTDALGSVYGLADATSAVVSSYSYDVYGSRTATSEAVPTKWGFTGRVHERDIHGTMYYRHREYDATVGRWMGAEPAGMVDGPNRYLFVRSIPTGRVDPTGQLTIAAWSGVEPPRDVQDAAAAEGFSVTSVPDDDLGVIMGGYNIVIALLPLPRCRHAVTELAKEVCSPLTDGVAQDILNLGTIWYAPTIPEIGIGFYRRQGSPGWPLYRWHFAYGTRSRSRSSHIGSVILHESMHVLFPGAGTRKDENRVEEVVQECGLPAIYL
jgi:RHS repeat-associated protein